jgi:hypothetical protein
MPPPPGDRGAFRASTHAPPPRLRRRAPSVLAIAALLVALATQFLITQGPRIPAVGVGFAVATLLLAASARLQGRATAGASASISPPSMRVRVRWQLLLLAGIVGVAVFFRFFRFTQFPPGLWYDEAINGTDAFSIIDHDHLTVWRTSNFGHSTVYFYLLIVSFKAFGYTLFAFRIVPALAGLAAVVAFYPLARRFLAPPPALAATALLAVSRFAVTFSRISWEASLQPLLEIMALYFLLRALETRSRIDFALAGGSLAAGLYTYLGFRFVPVMVLFLLLYIALADRGLIRRNLSGLIVYLAAFAIVVAPLAQYAAFHPGDVLARTRDINVFSEIREKDSMAPLWHNLRVSAQMMNVEGDGNGRHNLPGAPMLDEVSGALLVLGMAVCAWSWRDWRRGGLAGWLVLALVPGALTISTENPSGIRAVGAIPPLFLVIGVALAFLWRTLGTTRAGTLVFAAGAVALVSASGALNYHQFFDDQAHSRTVYDAFIPVYTDIGELAARESSAHDVYVAVRLYDYPAVIALTRGKDVRRWHPLAAPDFAADGRDAVVMIDARNFDLIPLLQERYPDLARDDNIDPYGRTYFSVLRIPAGDITAAPRSRIVPPTGTRR